MTEINMDYVIEKLEERLRRRPGITDPHVTLLDKQLLVEWFDEESRTYKERITDDPDRAASFLRLPPNRYEWHNKCDGNPSILVALR